MTNVPDNIRSLWTEVYKLFDKHFLLNPYDDNAWDAFWDDARQIYADHPDIPGLMDLMNATSSILGKIAARRLKK